MSRVRSGCTGVRSRSAPRWACRRCRSTSAISRSTAPRSARTRFRQALTAGIGAESAAALIAALDELARQQAEGDAGEEDAR